MAKGEKNEKPASITRLMVSLYITDNYYSCLATTLCFQDS